MKVDEQLIQGCIDRDRRAQYTLYKQCFGLMMSICYRYTNHREDAEEMLNLAFLKVLTNLESYRSDFPFGSWLRRVTVNSIIDQYRKNKKYKENEVHLDSPEDIRTERVDLNMADLDFEAEELKIMIMELPPMTRQVFNLYAIDGYKHAEVGEMLGISEGTSKWHLSNARKTLKKRILERTNALRYEE